MKNQEAYLSLSAEMQEKRDYFKELMQQTRFNMQESYGSYFICGTYERISDEPDKDLAIRLTREFGVATIPVSVFYRNGKERSGIAVLLCRGARNDRSGCRKTHSHSMPIDHRYRGIVYMPGWPLPGY